MSSIAINSLKAVGFTLLLAISVALLVSLTYIFVWLLLGLSVVAVLLFTFSLLNAKSSLQD